MREKVFKRYKKNLFEVEFLECEKNTLSSYNKMVMLSGRRDELKLYLESKGVETKIHYSKTLDNDQIGKYPNAESICAKALSLPIYPHLKMSEVDYICDRIKEFMYV